MTDEPLPLPDRVDPDGAGRRVTCGLCGAPLRDRASRRWGLGRECRRKLHLRTAPTPPAVDIDQDPLPGL